MREIICSNVNPSLGIFCNVCYQLGQSLWHPREFVIKHPTLMNLVPGVSYGSLLSIDTKISTNILSMTCLWRHNWYHVKYSENCQKSSKSRVFAIFVTKMCTYVVLIGVRVHLSMAFFEINSIKYKLCKYLLTKTWKTSFLFFSHWKVQVGSQWPPRTFDFRRDTLTPLKRVFLIIFRQNDRKGWTYNYLL